MVTDNAAITTTDYAGSYIYENSSLKFISQTEGYIEPDGAGGYEYVYQYKDQVNNVRLSYSDLNGDGVIDPNTEILHERNYYPFGMFHSGYNNAITGVKNNLKTYQDQEFTEDLDLNIHEWKYRFSDPTTGRFWQIDPLAEDYVYNSTYAFQENKMGMGVELEGLEMVTFQDKDGNNVVNVSYKVVNSTTGENKLSQEEVVERAHAIGNQFKASFEGKGADGSNTVVNVTYEFVDSASIENGDFFIDFVDKVTTENYDQLSESDKMRVDTASGKVDEVGNTQVNRLQVVGKDGNITLRENSITGAHETGHTGGLGHANKPDENTDAVNQGIQNSEFGSRGNLMKTGAVGTNIVPAQRTHLINTIKKQQKKQ